MATEHSGLLPEYPLEPLPDPIYGGKPGPYSVSPLRDVCGTRVHKHALSYYRDRNACVEGRSRITCAHPDLGIWINDISSLDPRAKLLQPPSSEWPLTSVIPRIPVTPRMPFKLPVGTFAIDLEGLGRTPESRRRDWVVELRSLFPEGSKLILTHFGNNAGLTLGLWTQPEFWQEPFLDNFDAILAPVFASYSDDPIPQALIGDRMQQIFASEGAAAGHTIVPSIAWTDERSLRNQVELWTSMYPKVNTILIDGLGHGVHPTLWKWRWLKAVRKYCAPHTEIRWLMAGFTAGWAIRELREMMPEQNFCLITSRSQFIHSARSTRTPEWQADTFKRKLSKIERLWDGTEIAEKLAEPDYWPDFSQYRA